MLGRLRHVRSDLADLLVCISKEADIHQAVINGKCAVRIIGKEISENVCCLAVLDALCNSGGNSKILKCFNLDGVSILDGGVDSIDESTHGRSIKESFLDLLGRSYDLDCPSTTLSEDLGGDCDGGGDSVRISL